MRRVRLSVLTVLAAAILALSAGAASAEGHFCRHWYSDPYNGGYWLWLQCGAEAGHWAGWQENLPWFYYEHNDPYNEDIREPLYY
jgi:hypothetical protein